MAARTVIVAFDGSVQSEIAFKYFAKNVHRDGDVVILVCCVEIQMPIPAPGISPPLPQQIRQMVENFNADSKIMMDKMKEILKKENISGTVVSIHGKPGEAIIRVSEERGANLIVTGSRGQGIIRRTILGSVSDYLVHHSHVPVLVCKH